MELGNMIFGHSRGQHEIKRGTGYEELLYQVFDACAPQRDTSFRDYGCEFENDTFEVHPYCWCDKEDCPQCGTGTQPNFRYKPTGFSMSWYKYPLRDAYMSEPMSLEGFAKMCRACIASVASNNKVETEINTQQTHAG